MRLQHGDVVIRLSKPRPFNPFCGLDWQLRDELNADAPSISVKAAMFSGAVSFEAATDTVQTTTARKNEVSTSYVEWQGSRYRCDTHLRITSLRSSHIQGARVLQLFTCKQRSACSQHCSQLVPDIYVWWLNLQLY